MRRGDVYMADFDPVRGHEQGRPRPALIVSADWFNRSPAQLVTVIPLTRTHVKTVSTRVAIRPPEGGLRDPSWAICEQLRTLSTERFGKRMGSCSPATLHAVADCLRYVLDLP